MMQRGEELLRARRVPEALEAFDKAEGLGSDPDACAGARWFCHMLLGDFQSAWRESEAIERRGHPDPNRFWNGQAIDGRHVLVRCLHGLGDTLQFIRYAPLVRARAASLTIEAQPGLKSLLQQSGLADHVITWREPEPHWDLQVEVIELPRIFGTTLDSIPNAVPYAKAKRTRIVARGEFKVGLVWASSAYNPNRSIPLPTLSRICNTPHCEFFSFQAGEEAAQLGSCSGSICDLEEKDGCVSTTASKLMNMDLLITVDTMIAHLAGALAKPVWTLLPFEADWRWMLDRDDSPWYPTMRLFRQQQPGHWEDVVDRVQESLIAALDRAA